MHFESLINFVAFNRKQPQRVFLPAGDPPPPARKPLGEVQISGKEALQANKEAQMVLQGALEMEAEGPNPVLGSVAKSLAEHLTTASVEILPETYGFMVRACIKVLDLPACSDFLVRMEASGQVLDSNLLDQVMELYWAKKQSQEPALGILPPHLRSAAERYQPGQASSSSTRPMRQGMESSLEQLSAGLGLGPSLQPRPLAPVMGGPSMGGMPMVPPSHGLPMEYLPQVGGMGAAMMAPEPFEPFSATAHLMGPPGSWAPLTGPGAAGALQPQRKRPVNGDAMGRRVDPDLPAFSIPEEFASKVAPELSTLSSAAPEFQPDGNAGELFEQMLALAKQGGSKGPGTSGLDPEAHEFLPGRAVADEGEVASSGLSSSKTKGHKLMNKNLSKPSQWLAGEVPADSEAEAATATSLNVVLQ